MSRKKIETEWFIEPLGSFSNEIITSTPDIDANRDSFPEQSVVENGLKRQANLYYCSGYHIITQLEKSREFIPGLNFNLFSRQGKNSPIRKTPLLSQLNKAKKHKERQQQVKTAI